MEDDEELGPLQKLLIAHAQDQAEWHRLVWTFDARLSQAVRRAQEPLIARMRLTWWHEALGDASGQIGKGEPLLDRLRTHPARLPALQRMAEGWEELAEAEIDDQGLTRFGEGRGGGLFQALAGTVDRSQAAADLDAAGLVWALWDLSGHASDERLAQRASVIAGSCLARSEGGSLEGVPRILKALAARDVKAGQLGPSTLTPRLYARFLRVLVFGG